MFVTCRGAYTTTMYRPDAVTQPCPTPCVVPTPGSPSVAAVRHEYADPSSATSTCRPDASPCTVATTSPDRSHPDGSVLPGDDTPAGPLPVWAAGPAADGVLADVAAVACLLAPIAGWTCASIPRKQTISAIAQTVLLLIARNVRHLPFQ